MWRDDYFVASELKDPIWHSSEWQIGSFSSEATTYSTAMCDTPLERKLIIMLLIYYMLLWYIASADWFIRTSTTDVCVTLPLILDRHGGTPIYYQ